jgi:hypothetical protein
MACKRHRPFCLFLSKGEKSLTHSLLYSKNNVVLTTTEVFFTPGTDRRPSANSMDLAKTLFPTPTRLINHFYLSLYFNCCRSTPLQGAWKRIRNKAEATTLYCVSGNETTDYGVRDSLSS